MKRYIPYGRQYINNNDIKEVVKVLKSDWITQGPKVDEFEKAIAKYVGVKYAVAVSSGTAALHLSCIVTGLKKGDEAITSPITFLATPNSVLYTGAKPVFADIDSDTVNIDPEEIKKKITKRTRVILPVHFSGLPCNMPEIAKIAKKHRLKVIEDASHALGAEYKVNEKWIKVGSCKHSDMTVFSFHPVKHITTGEGGVITTNNRILYEKLKALRTHGIYKDKKTIINGPWYYEMRNLGFNYRITDFQSVLGLSQLKKFRSFIKRRKEIASFYNKKLVGLEQIFLPYISEDLKPSWHLYVLRLQTEVERERKRLFAYLRKNDIGAQVHYIPVYLQPYYREIGYKKGICPKAEDFYKRAISIPIYVLLKDKEINYVVKKIAGFLKKI